MEIISSLNNSIYRFKYLYMEQMVFNLKEFKATHSMEYANSTIEYAKHISTLITDHTKYMNIKSNRYDMHQYLTTFEKFVNDSNKNKIRRGDMMSYNFDISALTCDMTKLSDYINTSSLTTDGMSKSSVYALFNTTVNCERGKYISAYDDVYIDMQDIRNSIDILNNPLDVNVKQYMKNYYNELSSVIINIEDIILKHNNDFELICKYLDALVAIVECSATDISNLFFYIHHRHNAIVSILNDIICRKEVRR